MKYFLFCLKNCINFKGRARRKEYWMFILWSTIIWIIIPIINIGHLKILEIILIIYAIVIVLANISVQARRLHDLDKSAWWILLNIIPLGFIVLLAWYCLKGCDGTNKYGQDPLFKNDDMDNLDKKAKKLQESVNKLKELTRELEKEI